jgi:hypothetical protein
LIINEFRKYSNLYDNKPFIEKSLEADKLEINFLFDKFMSICADMLNDMKQYWNSSNLDKFKHMY